MKKPDLEVGMIGLLIFLLGVLSLETACSGLPRLTEYDGAANAQAHLAPLVVVATTDSDVSVGRIVPSRKDSTYPMQLHRVKAHIENVLKGSINDATIMVYYFRFAGAIDGPRPLGFGREPSRRILWLRKDAGAYRMACDGWDRCTMVVRSGSHLGYRPDPTEPLNQALVDILLTRGKGEINDLQFANQIRAGVPDEGIRGYVIEKLRQLSQGESSEIENAACQLLWIYLKDQEDRIERTLRKKVEDSLRASNCNCRPITGGDVLCQ
jgi:hypothetical protein